MSLRTLCICLRSKSRSSFGFDVAYLEFLSHEIKFEVAKQTEFERLSVFPEYFDVTLNFLGLSLIIFAVLDEVSKRLNFAEHFD